MEFWFVLQAAINLVFLCAGIIMWIRLSRPPQDDPRLNRGLQLLQSKIVVLEDLSDRTDRQYQQMTQLLEQKTKTLQEKISSAREQIEALEVSMHKSLEVADLFQDKIPHEEIIERQNTIKYVKAAQLAHQGRSVDQIVEEIDLPREQVEFIAKVNREELVFDNSQLPDWLNRALNRPLSVADKEEAGQDLEDIFESSIEDESQQSLRALGERFREACDAFKEKEQQLDLRPGPSAPIAKAVAAASQKLENQVRKVVFPSI